MGLFEGRAQSIVQSPPRALLVPVRDMGLKVGLLIVGVVATVAILAPMIAPHDPNHGFGAEGLTALGQPLAPNAQFPLGTDRLGRDELSRLLFSARTSLLVGLASAVIATFMGTAVGVAAALLGDRSGVIELAGLRLTVGLPFESVLMRLTDAALAFPLILFAILLAATIGPSLALTVGLIASVTWATTARVIYARSLPIVGSDFITAARATGVGERRILLRHLLPHVLPLAAVLGSLTVAGAILIEASLSYLGVSNPAPTASWGSMLGDNLSYMESEPQLVLLPGMAIAVTVLGFTLLADGLGDALDPRRPRRSRGTGRRHAPPTRDAT